MIIFLFIQQITNHKMNTSITSAYLLNYSYQKYYKNPIIDR